MIGDTNDRIGGAWKRFGPNSICQLLEPGYRYAQRVLQPRSRELVVPPKAKPAGASIAKRKSRCQPVGAMLKSEMHHWIEADLKKTATVFYQGEASHRPRWVGCVGQFNQLAPGVQIPGEFSG